MLARASPGEEPELARVPVMLIWSGPERDWMSSPVGVLVASSMTVTVG